MRLGRLLVLPVLLFAARAHADAKSCKAGALIFGNPQYEGDEKPDPTGQTVTQDPPLLWRGIVLLGGNVYTTTGQEVWGGPVNGAIKRIAGEEQTGIPTYFGEGPCAKTRFGNIYGIAAQRDGSLIVADNAGNAVVKISDPLGPGCRTRVLVGAKGPYAVRDELARRVGNVDGAAATAKIGNPAWPVTEGSGKIYFLDMAAAMVKVIDGEINGTVSSVASVKVEGLESFRAMTLLDDKLYLAGSTFINGVIVEVDPETKAMRMVKNAGGSRFPPLDSSRSPALSSATNDGTHLIVSGRGYIWRVDPKSGSVAHIAGRGSSTEYPAGYNPAGVYPAKDLFLRIRSESNAGTSSFMTWSDNSIYWRGRDSGAYVLKISCP